MCEPLSGQLDNRSRQCHSLPELETVLSVLRRDEFLPMEARNAAHMSQAWVSRWCHYSVFGHRATAYLCTPSNTSQLCKKETSSHIILFAFLKNIKTRTMLPVSEPDTILLVLFFSTIFPGVPKVWGSNRLNQNNAKQIKTKHHSYRSFSLTERQNRFLSSVPKSSLQQVSMLTS